MQKDSLKKPCQSLWNGWVCIWIALAASGFWAWPSLSNQFYGEDEIIVLEKAENFLKAVARLDYRETAIQLLAHYHGPFMAISAIPGVVIAGSNEMGLRGPHLIYWMAAVGIFSFLAYRVAGSWEPALWTGFLLGFSGLFRMQVAGFGLSILAISLGVLALLCLEAERRLSSDETDSGRLLWVAVAVAFVPFLVYNTCLPLLAGVYVAFSAKHLIRSGFAAPAFCIVIMAGFFIGALLVCYYGFFIVLPEVWNQLHPDKPPVFSGHAIQYGARSRDLGFQISTWNVMQGWNTFFFPFLGLPIFVFGCAYALRKSPLLVAAIAPFAFMLLFVMNKSWHYGLQLLQLFLPFAIVAFWRGFGDLIWLFRLTCGLMLLGVGAWSEFAHRRLYEEGKYPALLKESPFFVFNATNVNIIRDYDRIIADIEKHYPIVRFVSVIGDGAAEYYIKRQFNRRIGFQITGQIVVKNYKAAGIDSETAILIDIESPEYAKFSKTLPHRILYSDSGLALLLPPDSKFVTDQIKNFEKTER